MAFIESYQGSTNVDSTFYVSLVTKNIVLSNSPTNTTKGVYQLFIDLSNMTASHGLEVSIWEKEIPDGGTLYPAFPPINRSGTQSIILASPPITLQDGWDIRVFRTSGSSLIIHYSIRKIGD